MDPESLENLCEYELDLKHRQPAADAGSRPGGERKIGVEVPILAPARMESVRIEAFRVGPELRMAMQGVDQHADVRLRRQRVVTELVLLF